MKGTRFLLLAAAAVLLVLTTSCTTRFTVSNTSDSYPAYAQALADLRDARAYLDKDSVSDRIDEKESRAINEIEMAIYEIKNASFDDGKDFRDHIVIDLRLARSSRFQKAIDSLDSARRNIQGKEDNRSDRLFQVRALDHVAEARRIVSSIILGPRDGRR